MKTEIFGLALALVMVVAIGATVLPAMAATEGSSEGSFDLGNTAPEVTSVALVDATDDITDVTSMDPTTEYAVRIEVQDVNTLNDIDQITVWIKEDGYTDVNDVRYQSTMKWTSAGGWAYDGPGTELSNSWDYVSGSEPSDKTGTSGTWVLHFKPGKVAIEDITAGWAISVQAKDKAAATSSVMTDQDISMTLYTEIAADDTSYSFGSVNLDTTTNAITTPAAYIQVSAVANGNYKLQSKTDDVWTGAVSLLDATVDEDGVLTTMADATIRLHARSIGTYGTTFTYLVKIATSGYSDIDGYSTTLTGPTPTGANGVTTDDAATHKIYQWLDVAPKGLLPDTYHGTYFVQIVDR